MHNDLIILTKDGDEYEKWNVAIEGNDRYKIFTTQNSAVNIHIWSGNEINWKDKNTLNEIITESTTVDSTVSLLAMHFGGTYEIPAEYSDTFNDFIPKISHMIVYSLGMSVEGSPIGIKKLHKTIETATEYIDLAIAYKKLFDLFNNEANKKKYEERINQIADLQLFISSYLLLEEIKEKTTEVNKKRAKLKEGIQKQAETLDRQEIISSLNIAGFSKGIDAEVCHYLTAELEKTKNALIDARNKPPQI